MNKRKRVISGLILILIIVIIGAFGTYSTFKANSQTKDLLSSQSPKITLEIFSGQVFMIDPNTDQDIVATNGQAVEVGNSIRTDDSGRAQVVYSTGTVTRIDHKSQMTITKADLAPQQITVNVTGGRVWSRVKKLLGQESYQTETGTVVAAVRGTSYGHGILADGRNKITTTKHTVSVNCLNDTQSGLVSQNMKFFLDCQTGSTSDIIPVDDSDQDEWYQFNLEQDRLLDARFGASTYDDEGEVQGVAVSPSPKSSVRPTPKISPKPTPIKTSTPTQVTPPPPSPRSTTPPPSASQPTPISTPASTPYPQALITSVGNPECIQNCEGIRVNITGRDFSTAASVEAIYKSTYPAQSFSQKGTSSITADFYKLPCLDLSVRVTFKEPQANPTQFDQAILSKNRPECNLR